MITCALALILSQQPTAGPKLTILPDPAARQIVLTAAVTVPFEAKAREAAAWRVLPFVMMRETKDYRRNDLLTYGGQGGYQPMAHATGDTIMIQLVMPPDGFEIGGELIESILMRPAFREEHLAEAIKTMTAAKKDPWTEALDPVRPPYEKISMKLLTDLHAMAFAPERISLTVTGPVEPQTATDYFGKVFKTKLSARRSSAQFDQPAPELQFRNQPMRSYEVQGEPIQMSAAGSGAKLLAVHALGAGKTSSVYRILREKERWSYRQEAFLWPTSKGWIPRLIMIRQETEEDAELLLPMIDSLLLDVQNWTEVDLSRVKSLSKAWFDGLPVDGVIWIGTDGPLGGGERQEGLLAAYTQSVYGSVWSRERLWAAMQETTLEELKAAATTIIKEGKTRMIPGQAR